MIELTIVMTIIAILSGLSLSSMYRSRDQVFIQHSAEKLKSDIRNQFINAISITGKYDTEAGKDCSETDKKVSKLRTIRIKLDDYFNSYDFVDYCVVGGVIGSLPFVSKNIDIGRELGFQKPATIALSGGIVSPALSPGYLHIVFSSPYGKYYAVKSVSNLLNSAFLPYNNENDSFYSSNLVKSPSFTITLSTLGSNIQSSTFSITKDGNIEE